jgi:glycosyltransferase involved in cell wall biosynthesis
MKILIVSQFFWPENFRINDLAEELSIRGHEVTVLTGIPNYPKGRWFEGYSYFSSGRDNKENIKLIRVPVIPRFSGKKWQLAINYISYVLCASIYGFFYCRKKYDVIFTYAPSPLTVGLVSVFLNKFIKVPHVLWVQDLWPEVFSAVEAPKVKIFYSLVNKMMDLIYRNTNLILVQSTNFIASIVERGVFESKVVYFPNWAEDLYKKRIPELGLIELDVPKDNFVAMFAGNIGAAQSIDTIVAAAELTKNKPISWVLLGDGRKRDWLESEVDKLNLRDKVHILGNQPVEQMPSYFACADVLLVTLEAHPVMSAWIPGKIQSYLASGKPVIGALNGAGADVINQSKCGFAVPAGDFNALAEKVIELSNLSTENKNQMGTNALNFYNREFNRESLITKLEEYFVKIT